ncbi:cytidyltransferase-like domain-containing protein [Chitinophaga eiseniae]|uniref:ethanolamine-phosphate cytidylyltransferase n=1 Tax=Chitinophaga eiseniae TaxID=634771 RepID=A0A1T4PV92_9BACT|nr:adenylyltransferase/cytidyltransferase family protein [Chitinophaga eiseniae]SJZ95472.1 cytidyltransferase-like domain-containing protein [Chitinophaga eiseniae]
MTNVYVSGVFDLFHEGHVNFLREASSYGRLIVGIHDDQFATQYKRRPAVPEKSRYAVVKSCRYVSEVIEGVGLLSTQLLEAYQIGLVLHGNDFSPQTAEKYFQPAISRGIFQFINYTYHISSSQILASIENRLK